MLKDDWRTKYPDKVLAPSDTDDESQFMAAGEMPIKDGFTRIPNWIIRHPAFYEDLNSFARDILLILQYRHRHDGKDTSGRRHYSNNGRIRLSKVEAAKLISVNRRTAIKAFGALINGGFIEEVTPAKFKGQEWTPPEWRLRYEDCSLLGKPAVTTLRRQKPVTSRKNPA
jgi:hypothetical protein